MSKESKDYKNMPKKIYIRTFGCQMNERDSEVILGLMQDSGFEITQDVNEADIVLVNTCSVRKHAEDKVWSEVGRFKYRKQKPLIGLVGCMAQNYKDEIFKRAPNVNFVVGPSDIGELPSVIRRLSNTPAMFRRRVNETKGIYRTEEIYRTNYAANKSHSYVIISEGCNNYCSYCVVPFVRGHLRSRDPEDIVNEVKRRVDHGIKEITLLGQNVNAYRYGKTDFIKLIKLVNGIRGLKSFGFVTSHPKDTKIELFHAMRDLKKLKKQLHLPVQSGSNRILRLMSRQYKREHYIRLAEEYKKIVRGKIGTDFIIGFPSETEKDFNDSLELLRNIKFDFSFIFKYSPRPHTKALSYEDDISRREKERRHKIILEEQRIISRSNKR